MTPATQAFLIACAFFGGVGALSMILNYRAHQRWLQKMRKRSPI